jgi:2-dehydro-3-deoxy-D-arabinonate dehydratase
MFLTQHQTPSGPRWSLDGEMLAPGFSLAQLLRLPGSDIAGFLRSTRREGTAAAGPLLAPVEPTHEVWAAGVTYSRSREAREVESSVKDVYSRVYDAERPELFFKAIGWRVAGHRMPIGLREDSRWNVPEPELTLVVNARHEVVGYCAGNDVSSRDIEGDNPLYLPQAKVYNRSCALGPGIVLGQVEGFRDLGIAAEVSRAGRVVFQGEARTSQMKRSLDGLVEYLCKALDFPDGVLLMTGTAIVPPPDFSLEGGDRVRVTVGSLTLENEVEHRSRSLQP